MKGKLIKTDKGDYVLIDPIKGTYDKGFLLGSSRETDVPKLSKQNCDEILEIVDVEKLAREYSINRFKNSDCPSAFDRTATEKDYINGFNKAMELNKDKVFTIQDMYKFATYTWKNSPNTHPIFDEEYLKQTTEIEVEFNPDEKDSEGCLILRKI